MQGRELEMTLAYPFRTNLVLAARLESCVQRRHWRPSRRLRPYRLPHIGMDSPRVFFLPLGSLSKDLRRLSRRMFPDVERELIQRETRRRKLCLVKYIDLYHYINRK